MALEKWVFHIDANSFYASVACQRDPSLRPYPVAVTGDPEARHGIVLAANPAAKKYGVKTAEAIWQAKDKCPGLVCVAADYEQYLKYSAHIKERILRSYTDRVESFGLDEAWIQVGTKDLWEAVRLADTIRERVKRELGITVSIGVADNKPIAKLGSDYLKPDATTVFAPESYDKIVWRLPAYELLYVGPATTKVLLKYDILTIGDLAHTEPDFVDRILGKHGLMIRAMARGEDRSPVMHRDTEAQIKSVGNSTTTPVDIETEEDARAIFCVLAESVSARMRENGFRTKCINVAVRTKELKWNQCQRMINHPTSSTREILQVAMRLFQERQYRNLMPFRSVGLQCNQLSSKYAPLQLDMFGREEKLEKIEALEDSVQRIRAKYGHQVIRLGTSVLNPRLAGINPRDDHRPPAAAYYVG